MKGSIEVGSIVRVPLSGRKTRGFVVELGGDRAGKLKDIAALSSQTPVFNPDLLKTLRWASTHYVAPLSVLLDRASPPNLPGVAPGERAGTVDNGDADHPLHHIAAAVANGKRQPTTAIVGRWRALDWLRSLTPLLAKEMSALIVTATEVESGVISEGAGAQGLPIVIGSGEVARELTDAWTDAQFPGRVVVGTPRVAGWQIPGLGLAVVLEEGRRAMKDRQTPTIHVRDLMTTRARVEGFSLVFFGPTPSVEVLAAGPEVIRTGTRAWGLVEVVDRSEDPPGSGFLAERSVAAIRAMTGSGRRSLVFTHRRSGESSMRCVECRRVRTCPACGSRIGREPTCRRCGQTAGPCTHCGATRFEEMGSEPVRLAIEINRRLGGDVAAPYPTDRLVAVGTERDLAALSPVPLVVAVDVDGLVLGHNYRTSEEALRILARLANALESGHGHRMMVQTSMPEAPLMATLRRGDPVPYLEGLLSERASLSLPPASEMLAVEIRGEQEPDGYDRDIRSLQPKLVLGPAPMARGWRWLLQGSLGAVKLGLRPLVQRWRESGATVRIDADPIDL